MSEIRVELVKNLDDALKSKNREMENFLLNSIAFYVDKLRTIDYNENHPKYKEWMHNVDFWYELKLKFNERD